MIELFDRNVMKILTIFSLSSGSRLNRKTIKEMTQMPNVIVNKTLAKLTNCNFLTKEKNLFALNFKNEETKRIIQLCFERYNKFKHLPLKEYFTIIDIGDEISKIKNIGDVYLFGSYAKLTFNEKSDIDLAIVTDDIRKKDVNVIVRKLEKRYKKTIELHQFTRKFYNNKRDALVKEIIQQGIRLI